MAPVGAATAEVTLRPVRKTIPFEPGSASPAGAVADCCTQVFAVGQPYRFRPDAASVLKYRSPGEQVAGREVPVFNGLVKVAPVKSTFLPCVAKLMSVVCPKEAQTVAAESKAIRSAV